MAQCKAKSKRTGERCRRAAVAGKEVCYIHGGATPSGPDSPHWKHGRYARGYADIVPKRLVERYEAALNDRQALSMRAELALIDARLADMLARVDSGESGSLWKSLRETWRTLERAQRQQDAEKVAESLVRVGELIRRGYTDSVAWREVGDLIERRRRLAESERKRELEAKEIMRIDEGLALVSLLMDAVKRHVSDPRTLAAIAAELSRVPAGTPG